MRTLFGLTALLVLAVGLSGGPAGGAAQAPQGSTDRPDILFVAMDDLKDWVGPLGGHPQARTPNMDRLAERGLVFTNAHTAATSCNPSRTALMTGLRPATSGVYGNGQDWRQVERLRGVTTLPHYFRNVGYRTLGGGKLFHAHTYTPDGFFGTNDAMAWDAYYPSISRALPDEVGPPRRPANGNPLSNNFDWSAVVAEDAAMGDGQVVAWAERQIAEAGPRAGRPPLFLGVGIYRPHLPWYVPQKYLDMHPLDRIELPPTLANDLDDVPEIAARSAFQSREWFDWAQENGKWREAVQAYLASISFADAMLGRLLDALDRSGRADQTIIVLWSDHGFHMGEKQRFRKNTLWEEVSRVPLIVSAPGVTTPGTRSSRTVSLLDLYPTLADLAGLPIPDHVEGMSLLPLLRDPGAPWDRAALTNNGYREHAVRDERYRYVSHRDGTEELYDVLNDPQEWTNLAGDPSLGGVKSRLARWLPTMDADPPPPPPGRGRGQGRGQTSGDARRGGPGGARRGGAATP